MKITIELEINSYNPEEWIVNVKSENLKHNSKLLEQIPDIVSNHVHFVYEAVKKELQ